MKKNGILFDLDGTLWEVKNSTFESANKIAKKHKLKEISMETICAVFGLNKFEVAQLYFPYLELNQSLSLLDEIEILNIKNLKEYGGNIYPNLKETLESLRKKYELFIVSNTSKSEYIEAFLTSAKLNNYFKDYIAASELGISKADAIKKIIDDYKLDKAVYVGDTQKDMEASDLAKIPFIQAKYGFGKNLNAKYYINTFKELPYIVEKLI